MNRYLLILLGIICIPPIIFILFALISEDKYNRKIVDYRSKWILENNKTLQYLYTDIFPKARSCAEKSTMPTTFDSYLDNCNGEVRSLIDSKYDSLFDLCNNTPEGCHTGWRQPLYFIKLQDDKHIEKLFQSGVYFVETVDTREEKEVVKMLQGKRDPFLFPLYNCCGGDDWLENIPLLPDRVFLKDRQTEIELIFPIKDDQGKILGGFVQLYGD